MFSYSLSLHNLAVSSPMRGIPNAAAPLFTPLNEVLNRLHTSEEKTTGVNVQLLCLHVMLDV